MADVAPEFDFGLSLPSGLVIGSLALGGSLFSELVNYVSHGRLSKFRTINDFIAKGNSRIKDLRMGAADKNNMRELKSLEREVKSANEVATRLKLPSIIVNGIWGILLFQYVRLTFKGHVAGSLPFKPFKIIDRVVKQGLSEPGETDTSAVFIFILFNIAAKQLTGRIFRTGSDQAVFDLMNSPQIKHS